MATINKVICDECGKEYDVSKLFFFADSAWNRMNGANLKDLCSKECLIKMMQDKLDSLREGIEEDE